MISAISSGLGGEIIILLKYGKSWNSMFKEHKLDTIYKTAENFEHFCYLNYLGIDAESVFVEKIKTLKQKVK